MTVEKIEQAVIYRIECLKKQLDEIADRVRSHETTAQMGPSFVGSAMGFSSRLDAFDEAVRGER